MGGQLGAGFETFSGVEISPINRQDLSAIVSIQRKAMLDTYPVANHHISKDMIWRYVSGRWVQEVKRHYQSMLDEGYPMLAARVGGAVVGFCNIEPAGYIDALFIPASYRRKRIGSLLLLAHGQAGAFDDGARLHVVQGTPAEQIYKHIGFRPTDQSEEMEIADGHCLQLIEMIMDRHTTAEAMTDLRERCEAAGLVVPMT